MWHNLEQKERIKTGFGIALVCLGLHYVVILLAVWLNSGGFSLAAMGDMITNRLSKAGDAERYLDIARNGYAAEGENAINLVFYPLYPALIRVFGWLTGQDAVAGVLLSQACYAGASVLLYDLICMDGTPRQGWTGVLLMALYPFSMFAMGVYTEGLFLLMSIGCLLALRKQKFWLAGIAGFLAALTRTQGMLLFFPAVYEVAAPALGKEKRRLRSSDLWILLIPLGFGVYLLINFILHGNPFQFLIYEAGDPWFQTTHWVGRNISLQTDMALEYMGLDLVIYWVQIALYFASVVILLMGVKKGERVSWLLYGAVYLGFTYLSGWMISGGRYMLGCVPLFLVLAKCRHGLTRRLMIFLSTLLFFAYSYFFLIGYPIM